MTAITIDLATLLIFLVFPPTTVFLCYTAYGLSQLIYNQRYIKMQRQRNTYMKKYQDMKKIQRNCKDYKKQVSYMGKEMQKYRCFEKELKTELKIRGLTDDQIEEAYKNARMMC